MKIENQQLAVKDTPSSSRPLISFRLILVLIVVMVGIGLALYILIPKLQTKKDDRFVGDDPFLLKDVTFFNTNNETRTKDLLTNGINSKAAQVSEESLLTAFFLLRTDYQEQPTESKRKSLTAIHDYYALKFPKNVAKVEPIPCLEVACGYKFEDSDQIQSLREVLENKDVNSDLLFVLSRNLNDAALAHEKNIPSEEFIHLENFFINLKNGTQENRTQEIIDKLNETLDILEKLDQERFKIEVEKDTLKL